MPSASLVSGFACALFLAEYHLLNACLPEGLAQLAGVCIYLYMWTGMCACISGSGPHVLWVTDGTHIGYFFFFFFDLVGLRCVAVLNLWSQHEHLRNEEREHGKMSLLPHLPSQR